MRFLFASLLYPPALGGGEVHLHETARGLSRRGHDVRAVTQWSRMRRDWLVGSTLRCDPPASYEADGIPVERLGYSPLTRLRMLPSVAAYRALPPRRRGPAIRSIARTMRRDFARAAGPRPDLVHGIRIGCEFLATAARDHARRLGVPFVINALHHPGWDGDEHAHYAALYRDADAVIALTEYEREVLIGAKGVAPERVFVTGIGPLLAEHPKPDSFRQRHGLQRPFVLYLGRKVEHKGWRETLDAARAVHEKHPGVDLVFAGVDTRESRAAFAECRDPRVRNLGTLSLDDKTAALAACEFLCMPSSGESFGGVYVEAWKLGKAVIAGDLPSVRCVVDDGVNGELVPRDTRFVADAIVRLLDDPARSAAMGRAGREKVDTLYDLDRILDATLRAYAAALDRPIADLRGRASDDPPHNATANEAALSASTFRS